MNEEFNAFTELSHETKCKLIWIFIVSDNLLSFVSTALSRTSLDLCINGGNGGPVDLGNTTTIIDFSLDGRNAPSLVCHIRACVRASALATCSGTGIGTLLALLSNHAYTGRRLLHLLRNIPQVIL